MRNTPRVPMRRCRRGYAKSWSRIPPTPKVDSQRPMVAERRPRPPVKAKNAVGSAALSVAAGGVLRYTGKMCMKAELCRGSRPKETRALITFRVQICWNGGFWLEGRRVFVVGSGFSGGLEGRLLVEKASSSSSSISCIIMVYL